MTTNPEIEIIETLPAPAKAALNNANLPASKAAAIVAVFKPCMDELNSFGDRLDAVLNQPEITEQLSKDAKRLRLDIAKVRVAGDKARKEAKEESLRFGQAIDGVYKFIALAATENESRLEEIEKHQERMEAERIAKLQLERALALEEFEVCPIPGNLGSMPDDVWANYLAGTKLNYEARKEAEEKAELERIARQQAEEEERERVRLENERLKAEAAEREKVEAERRAKEAADKAKLEAKLKKEREAAAAKLEAERKEREKVEAELRAKQEAEETSQREEAARIKREAEEREAAERAAAAAPDKEKLMAWAASVRAIEAPSFTSPEAIEIARLIKDGLEQFARRMENAAENLGQSKAA